MDYYTSSAEYTAFLQENYDLLTNEDFNSLLSLVESKLTLNNNDNQSVKDTFDFSTIERKISLEQYKELAEYVNLHNEAIYVLYKQFK